MRVGKQKAPDCSGAFQRIEISETGLRDDKDDVRAAVFGHVGIGAIFNRTLVSQGNDFDASSRDAESLEVLLGCGGATVAEAEVVLFRATPVAVTFEEDAVGRVGVEVFLGFLKFGAFAFFDTSAIEIEVNGLGTTELVAFKDQTVGASGEIGTWFREIGEVAAGTTAEAATARAYYSRARIRPGRFFDATGEDHSGAEESDG